MSKSSRYDEKLLDYYYGKDFQTLESTHTKYKSYAEQLAKKCELTREQIEKLYEDMKSAKAFLRNAKELNKLVEKEKRKFENGDEEKPQFPWCCPRHNSDDEDDLDDVADEVKNNETIKKLTYRRDELKNIQTWYTNSLQQVLNGTSISDIYNDVHNNLDYNINDQEEINKKLEETRSALEKEVRHLRVQQWVYETCRNHILTNILSGEVNVITSHIPDTDKAKWKTALQSLDLNTLQEKQPGLRQRIANQFRPRVSEVPEEDDEEKKDDTSLYRRLIPPRPEDPNINAEDDIAWINNFYLKS